MSELRPRGLGRGLSALLGEPVRTEPPKPANAFAPPQPAPTPVAEAPRPAVEPPRNVFELPVANVQQQPPAAPPQPAPQPAPVAQAAPSQAALR